jgi:hypothetical protein
MNDNEIINDAAFGQEGFKYRKRTASVFPIDRTIQPLVELLNRHPGIATVGSCGGHPNPKPTQQPEGQWFVSFMISTWDSHGHDGLDWLRTAMRDLPSIRLTETYCDDTFFLVGKEVHLEQFLHALGATITATE